MWLFWDPSGVEAGAYLFRLLSGSSRVWLLKEAVQCSVKPVFRNRSHGLQYLGYVLDGQLRFVAEGCSGFLTNELGFCTLALSSKSSGLGGGPILLRPPKVWKILAQLKKSPGGYYSTNVGSRQGVIGSTLDSGCSEFRIGLGRGG